MAHERYIFADAEEFHLLDLCGKALADDSQAVGVTACTNGVADGSFSSLRRAPNARLTMPREITTAPEHGSHNAKTVHDGRSRAPARYRT